MEGLLPKWLRNWLARLLPSNHSSGDGAVHISRLHGNVTTITNNIQQVVDTSGLRDEQLELLRSIRKLPGRGESVLNFMDRKYGTRMVVDLRPSELRVVQQYVAGAYRRLSKKQGVQ